VSKGFDIGGLFRQAQQLQEKLASVQQEIGARTVEASAGGGMVTAVINGIRAAQKLMADEMGKVAGGLGLGIKLPGMP